MMVENLRVFVYGTLKPGEVNYQRYCAGRTIEEKSAIAWGQLFDLPCGYPAMILGNQQVYGFLLTFTDTTVLEDLDRLEDYNPHRLPEQNEYNRQQIEVFDGAGKSLGNAWAYFMTPQQIQRANGIFLPQGWWSGYPYSEQ
jgi:gamma-glutamylcyclotransferase (GGCT)/AIG2-like uncharacterized protein YtfP